MIGAHLDSDKVTWKEDAHPIGVGTTQIIKGVKNDGNETGTGSTNCCKLSVKSHPSFGATAGKHNFIWRVVYTFGD